ncbi:hypothetical protein CXG81DRAFT_19719 [Caulochytrium protostelioides]|uniref:Uncharacterized protein n=1 Tax=Caulochytrium protostelioides TaxID=1555241 RepID=A0A4P9X5D1_9FUNG|nr:hypothetical protein CXG81DRAFT_19719 [Caulochytrium protostelioides]|eukprot:RKP00324.1 hypothetical protein CXG81DRAFT_19719 [Caulochytrium protostelioides]
MSTMKRTAGVRDRLAVRALACGKSQVLRVHAHPWPRSGRAPADDVPAGRVRLLPRASRCVGHRPPRRAALRRVHRPPYGSDRPRLGTGIGIGIGIGQTGHSSRPPQRAGHAAAAAAAAAVAAAAAAAPLISPWAPTANPRVGCQSRVKPLMPQPPSAGPRGC